jgi:hypothetical protein
MKNMTNKLTKLLAIKLLFCLTTKKTLGILQKISPLFFQNKKIATATIHFLKFQAQAAILLA